MEGAINRVARLARLGYFCCLGLVILAIFTINPVSVSGDEANATTGTATSANTSLSLTTNHDNAVVTITPNNANGTFAMSSAAGEAQFGVTTNNFTGYELSIVADDDNGNLVNIDNGNTHTISSIPSSITKSSFDTTTYNNKWGFKPNKYLGPNSTIVTNTGDSALFLPSPTTTGTILDHTTVANSSANNYSIALGVRADYNTYAGSYTKNFTLAAIANPTTYIIDYNKNTSDTVTNMPTAQSSATSATSITLASNTPERENYNFLGWCTVQTVDSSCSGTTYQPGDTYGLDQTTENITTLYAIWQSSTLVMQNVTLDTCPTEPTEVVDSRDGEIYTIQKLADGKCWLLDNLRLDLVNVPLTDLQGKTNAEDITLYYLKNGGRSAGDNYPTSGVANHSVASSGYNYSDPLIATSGSCYDSDCVNNPSSGQWTKDSLVSYGNGTGKIGVYYNLCAASAGSYCYGNGTSSVSHSGNNATEDICPAGWRIPTGGSSGEYQALYTAYNSNAADFMNALHTVSSGIFLSSYNSALYQNKSGQFWSSTYYSSNSFVYNLYVSVYYNSISTTSSERNDKSVRCILDPLVNYAVSYNKNTAGEVSDMPSNQTISTNSIRPITLSDITPARDNYVFIGWCDTQPNTSNNIDSCSGTMVHPGGSYAVNSSSTNLTFYAMWAISSSTIQNTTYSTCPTTPTEVVDSRDGEVYTIQKLADGKCWLLDNLRLDLSTIRTLTPADTNISSSWTVPSAMIAAWSDVYDAPKIAISGPCYNTSACVNNPSSGQWTKDSLVSYGNGTGKIGVYYNYCAATAGTYCYASGAGTGNATNDICPKGWRMPTGGDSGEYQYLYTVYNSNVADFNNALRAPLSGTFRGRYAYAQRSGGYFWSSTYYNSNYIYQSFVNTTTFGNTYRERYEGATVRCVLDLRINYELSYNKNTTDAVSNMPTSQTGVLTSFADPITLSSNIPSRSGYVFLGWCDNQPVIQNYCTGNIFTPQSDIRLTPDGTGDIRLYAMWAASSSAIAMQGMSPSDCTAFSITLVYDTRDNETYLARRLADGNCWLLDNLRLDPVSVSLDTLKGRTNASDTTLEYFKGTTSGSSPYTGTAVSSSWPTGYNSSTYNTPFVYTALKNTVPSSGYAGKTGVYYNYCAATAGSYCTQQSTSITGVVISEDVCPVGWRMPTGGTSGEYQALYASYSSNDADFKNALRTAFSGYVYQGGTYGQDSYGDFWSSTRDNNTSNNAHTLMMTASELNPQASGNRSNGYSVRCVLAKRVSEISTLQEMSPATSRTMVAGQVYTLADGRDGKSYDIAKLADGKVWLLDNLRLSLAGKTLTAADTNLVSGSWAPTISGWSLVYDSPKLVATYSDDVLSNGYQGKLGTYYNYCAATAGTICTSSRPSYYNAPKDICPKGWRMPTGGSGGEYRALYSAYSNNYNNFVNALHIPFSGIVDGSYGRPSTGSDAAFWTSTSQYNDNAAYVMRMTTSSVETTGGYLRQYGLPIRCVLQ